MTRLLSAALDRSLTLQEHMQVHVHLPVCSGCRAYRGQIAMLRAAAHAAAGRDVTADDARRESPGDEDR